MRRETLLDAVTAALGRDVVGGVWSVGATLPREDELCVRFSVARSVVREAVRQLAAKGMITTHRRGGTRITERETWNYLDPDVLGWTQATDSIGRFLDKLFQFRMALEPAASEIAAEQRSQPAIKAIRSAFEMMSSATEDFEAWIDADLRFHQGIYLATCNELYWPVGRLFENALRASFRLSSSHQHHQHCLPEHQAVLEAIERGRPKAARQATCALLAGADMDIQIVLHRQLKPGARRISVLTEKAELSR